MERTAEYTLSSSFIPPYFYFTAFPNIMNAGRRYLIITINIELPRTINYKWFR